jgi:transposase-like protein
MGRGRRTYPAEFRRQMVGLTRSGRPPESLSREFESSAEAIRYWVRQANREEAGGESPPGPSTASGGCASCWVSPPAATTRGCSFRRRVASEQTRNCRSGFGESMSVREDVWGSSDSRRARGRRCKGEPQACGESFVRRWPSTTVRDKSARPAPDLMDRQFACAGRDCLWVADITYIRVGLPVPGRGSGCLEPMSGGLAHADSVSFAFGQPLPPSRRSAIDGVER